MDATVTIEGDKLVKLEAVPVAETPPVVPPLPPVTPPVVVPPIVLPTIPPAPPAGWSWPRPATGIFAAPLGTAAGVGTITNPMSIEKALGIGGAGQQIWLRGGRYDLAQTISPRLGGSAAVPWKISAYPGEEPTLNINTGSRHGILFNSAAMAFQEWRGIRFTDLSAGPGGTTIYNLIKADFGNAIGFIHCQFDNCKRSGILLNATASNFWFYGCAVLNNGVDAQFDHGAYVKSRSGTLAFENCFFLNNAGHQLHGYNSSLDPLEGIRGIRAIDNAIFTFGEPAKRFIIFDDEGQSKEARDCIATGNLCYNSFPKPSDATDWDRSTIKIVNGINSRIEDNFIWGGDIAMLGGVPSVLRNQIMRLGDWPKQQSWVRPSRFDPGICHVTIFNPAQAAIVAVDLTGLIPAGRYEIRAASSPQKVEAVSIFSGAGTIMMPMAGLTYDAQIRTGGFNWQGGAKANGFILRRIP